MIFGVLNPGKFDINNLYTCPPHLYTIATLPWEIQKSHFQQYYSYILQIITSSQKKTNCYSVTHQTWKMPLHYLVKCTTSLSDWTQWRYVAFLQTLVDLKWAGCGLALVPLKRTGCDMWQMECQASNVTANVQSGHLLHGYKLAVFFATDQLHHCIFHHGDYNNRWRHFGKICPHNPTKMGVNSQF